MQVLLNILIYSEIELKLAGCNFNYNDFSLAELPWKEWSQCLASVYTIKRHKVGYD